MSVLNTGLATPSRGYDIDQSLRFNDNDSAYLSWTPSSDGNQKTFTFSCWFKLGNLPTANTSHTLFAAGGSNRTGLFFKPNEGSLKANLKYSAGSYAITLNREFRDPSAFYHIVWAVDTTQGTSSNRNKIYINGVLQTDFAASAYPAQNADVGINNTEEHNIGRYPYSDDFYWDGYLAEVHFIDGTALTPTSFGETGDYGEWKPIEVSDLTYGNNGFYLDFADSGNLGDDVSGNGNDWAENNLSASDQMLDTPTNNFATLNPLNKEGHTLSEGNLLATCTADWVQVYGTQSIIKNYFESQILSSGSPQDNYFGISTTTKSNNVRLSTDGTLYKDGTTISSNTSFTTGDIIGMAVDVPSGTIQFYKNGSANGNTTISTTDDWVAEYRGANTRRTIWNFGQDSSFAGNKTAQGNADSRGKGDFYYTPPSGFLALCTANLSEPAVKPSQHFNTITYSGDSTNRTLTGVGFQSDLTWIKSRTDSSNGSDHWLFDAVRGVNAFTGLCSNGNSVEGESEAGSTQENFGDISAFTSDGFSVYRSTADPSHQYEGVNRSGDTYVAWNWKANGSGSANTNGSITSTVSANVDAGFSIVTATKGSGSQTIGHGLSSAPELLIVKNRGGGSWEVFHASNTNAPATDYLRLNSDGGTVDDSSRWNDTAPTSSVFTVATAFNPGENLLAYCFHSVDGYSKVGSYVGNGDTDGPFVYTGFRPAYVVIKRTSGVEMWNAFDDARSPYNLVNDYIKLNEAGAEKVNHSSLNLDFTSNGFKIKGTNTGINTSGATYIFLCFAEQPFKYSNAK